MDGLQHFGVNRGCRAVTATRFTSDIAVSLVLSPRFGEEGDFFQLVSWSEKTLGLCYYDGSARDLNILASAAHSARGYDITEVIGEPTLDATQ